jgi:hypothetical protein
MLILRKGEPRTGTVRMRATQFRLYSYFGLVHRFRSSLKSGNRLLTRAAPIRAATVTERLPRNTTHRIYETVYLVRPDLI